MYLPKKWVDDNGLGQGDEVDVNINEDTVIVKTQIKAKKSEISLDISSDTESGVRTILTNAYRIGYDVLHVTYSHKKQLDYIKKTVKNNLLGFDLLEEESQKCVIENIAEPSIEKFDVMFDKIFHITNHLFDITLENFNSGSVDLEQISSLVIKLQEYDNFCRRAISKRKLIDKRNQFYWILFTYLVQIARHISRLNESLDKGIKASNECVKLFEEVHGMFELLRKSYLSKSTKELPKIHDLEKSLIYEEGYDLLTKSGKDHILIHHIIDIARFVYIANSPLYGLLLE